MAETDISIPREALEAAARAHAKANEGHDEWWPLHVDKVRASCLAMLQNWPGMYIRDYLTEPLETSIILPLTENPNDKG